MGLACSIFLDQGPKQCPLHCKADSQPPAKPKFYILLEVMSIMTLMMYNNSQFSHSVVSDSLWPPWTVARQASGSITNSQSLFKLMSIELVMPSNRLTLCHPLLLLPSIFPSIRIFPNELILRIRWPKYWSFSFSISPSNEYSGLISFTLIYNNTQKPLRKPEVKNSFLICVTHCFQTYLCIKRSSSCY